MASFVVYDKTQTGESNQRVNGMKEAADRILAKMALNRPKEEIIIGTIDELIQHVNFEVKFTDRASGKEFPIAIRSTLGAGKYKYTDDAGTVKKIKIKVHRDKEENDGSENVENMNVTVPGDNLVQLGSNGYLAGIIGDVGGTWSQDRAKFLFATIALRRCR